MAEVVSEPERQVLPTDIMPKSYELQIFANFEEFSFQGTSCINCEVKSETSKLVVHQKELLFSEAKVQQGDFEELVQIFTIDAKRQTCTLSLKQELKQGPMTVTFKFKGWINDRMNGFYRSKHTEENGDVAWIGTTQFEATEARSAFPCFDEPSLKATFDISIIYPEKYTCLSNMPEKPSVDGLKVDIPSGYTRSSFITTPVMSTYLLAWCIGKFDMIEQKTSDQSTLCRVFTTPGKIEEGRFALESGVKAVEFYEQYFGIPYPLPKLDQIGIPDFDAGAMENWGLVTYRLSMFLASEETSTSTKTVALTTVTHELAHMWFGNLVSPEWWSQLWLKEGFACYLQYLCAEALHPEWNFWKRFVEDEMVYALRVDSMTNSHPIEVPVKNSDEIDEIFDGISYSKGACVIRMIVNYLGEEQVKKGLNKYLTDFSYKNATTNDLWKYLSSEDTDVKDIMDEWTKCQGFPYLKISRESATEFVIEQHRFLSAGPADDEDDQTIWTVPVEIRAEGREDTIRLLITQRFQKVTIDGLSEDAWVKFNTDYTGFYVCQYDEQMTSLLSKNLQSLSTLDRFSLVKDYSMLMKAGFISTTDVLELISGFKEERDYSVWEVIDSALGDIKHMLQGHENAKEHFNAFVIELFNPLYDWLGWDVKKKDSYETKLLRSLSIRSLGMSKYGAVVEKGQELFRTFLQSETTIHPDLRNAVFSIGVRFGSADDFESMFNFYKKSEVEDDKERILRRLGSFQDVSLIKRALEISLSDDVRLQDFGMVVSSCGRNEMGGDLTLQTFVKEKWDMLFKKTSGGHSMSWVIHSVGNLLGMDKAQDIEDFFKSGEHKRGSADRAIKQVCEKIRTNTACRDRNLEGITIWLENRV